MLRRSRPTDLPALKALWRTCFGDEDAYLDLYFDHYWQPEGLFVLEEAGAVRSMAAWFQLTLNGQAAAYFYAVATDPDWQGRGFCRRLMAYAEQILADQGICQFLLVPGSESLFRFYGNMGYATCGAIGSVTVDRPAPGPVTEIDVRTYLAHRHAALPDHGVWYPSACIAHQQRLSRFAGYGLYALGDRGCAAVESLGNGRLLVKECLGCDPVQAGSWLLEALGGESALVRYPDDQGRPFCMGKGLTVPRCYLGLAFD